MDKQAGGDSNILSLVKTDEGGLPMTKREVYIIYEDYSDDFVEYDHMETDKGINMLSFYDILSFNNEGEATLRLVAMFNTTMIRCLTFGKAEGEENGP